VLFKALEAIAVVKTLLLIGHASHARMWEHELATRLRDLGYTLLTTVTQAEQKPAPLLDVILEFEARKFGASSASPAAPLPLDATAKADLVIDLTGNSFGTGTAPVLTITIAGAVSLAEGLQRLPTISNSTPDIVARLNGEAVAVARPMLSDKVWLSRDCCDVLAASQSLIVHCVGRFFAGRLQPIDDPQTDVGTGSFAFGYGRRLLQGLAGRLSRKLKPGSRPFYWQTGYRRIDGPGVAESGKLDGMPFTLLPDDGQRFYADPFAFEYQGRSYLFLEEFPYALGRGIISVTELKPDGTFGPPRPVLQEPHHLSYPNVFEYQGAVFMLPESGGANELVLYRAERFPDIWVRDTVLLSGRCFNDATLLEHDGRLWMFGTERFGKGSASDTLMVFSATDLRGPWREHPLNPILIDRAGARPGGHVAWLGARAYLPVQDGTLKYGGGLSLREIIQLDDEDVVLGPILPIASGPAWHGEGIHTLTRSGRLETIDSTP
jgi:hypothetical protein